jgi:hypothetical protein
MSLERQLDSNAVVIGKGAAVPAKTILRGAANTVLTQTVVNEEPAFTKLNLGTMVTGVLDLATMVTGDLPVGHGGVPTDGAANTVLTQTVAGADPAFTKLNAATMVTGLLPAANGGTGLNTSASTGVAQITAGTWSVSAIDLATADVTGVLPVANGGSGAGIITLTYGPTIGVPNAAASNWFLVIVTNAVAHAVPAPINASAGRMMTLSFYNNTAGAIATATFDAIYHLTGYVAPAPGIITSACLLSTGATWYQVAPWTSVSI